MAEKTLRVCMLGRSTLEYGDKPLFLERTASTNAMQLLMFFLYFRDEKIPRGRIIQSIYSDQNIGDPCNNLKVNLFRLRKLLAGAISRDEPFISFEKGFYSWMSALPLEVDVHQFRELARRGLCSGQPWEERQAILKEAAALYKGELLPELSTSQWVIEESRRQKEMYLSVVHALADQHPDSNALMRAIKLYPLEESLRIIRIRGLLDAGNPKAAMAAYHEACTVLFRELNVLPSGEMQQLSQKITQKMKEDPITISDMQAILQEAPDKTGAYYCNYFSFLDSYRILMRMAQRSGQCVSLLLFSITDFYGKAVSGKKLDKAADLLENAIQQCIRRGDIFTRYNQFQFIVLLIGVLDKNCHIVSERIHRRFVDGCDPNNICLQCGTISALDFNPEKTEQPFSVI